MLELLFSDFRPHLQNGLALVVCITALIWGGAPERILALAWVVLFEIANYFQNWVNPGGRLEAVDWYLAMLDIIGGIVFVWVALAANRNYTLWIAGLQVLAMIAHLARGLADAVSPVAYITMVIAPGWLQLIFLGIGVSRHIMRKRKYGNYRDWRRLNEIPDARTATDSFDLSRLKFGSSGKIWRDELK